MFSWLATKTASPSCTKFGSLWWMLALVPKLVQKNINYPAILNVCKTLENYVLEIFPYNMFITVSINRIVLLSLLLCFLKVKQKSTCILLNYYFNMNACLIY